MNVIINAIRSLSISDGKHAGLAVTDTGMQCHADTASWHAVAGMFQQLM
jgi:hypothetical protein